MAGSDDGYCAHMSIPPPMTSDQRAAALVKAAEARAARALIKERLASGDVTLRAALESDDSHMARLKVVTLLESLPGIGKVKARRIMDEIGIAGNRKVQGLGPQQRKALVERLVT